MKLKYDEAVEKLKDKKIRYYLKYKEIPVDKFEKEELLKIIDLFCGMIKMHQNHGLNIHHLLRTLELEF